MTISTDPKAGPNGAQRPAYLRDSRLRRLETTVLVSGDEPKGNWVQLADTVLYPEGGGQPSDRGTIGGVPVVEVLQSEGATRHFLDSSGGDTPPEGAAVTVELDWERRWDLMQQHTAQHLITALAADRFGWPTTSFHLGQEGCDIELDSRGLTQERLDELEESVAAEIRAGREIKTRWVTRDEYEVLADDVRTRGLPADHRGAIRLVEIEGIDLNTCGGTHLATTAEIETVKLLGWEKMRGGSRLHWVAGGRVRRRLARHEQRCAEMRGLLEAADDELVAVATVRLERLDEAVRRARMLTERLGATLVERWCHGAGEVLAEHLDWGDADTLRALSRALSEAGQHRLALLTVGQEAPYPFVLVSPGGELAATAGPTVLERLGGKGGGRGAVFQGRAERPVEPAADVEWLRGQLVGAER